MSNGWKRWTVLGMAVLAGGMVAFTAAQPKDKQPQMTPEQQKEMEKWQKASTPNENHKLLEAFVGNWNAECAFTMAEGAPEEKSTGTMTTTSIFEGRFVKEEFTGTMMGMPFKGLGYWGYDNLAGKFVSTWMDSMGTMIMVSKGDYSSADKAWTMLADIKDPDGVPCHSRQVTRVVDKDKFVMEFYNTVGAKPERKEGQITFTRKK